MDVEAIRKLKADIKEKVREKGSREARTSGSTHQTDLERELGRSGVQRTPDDIPFQDQGRAPKSASVHPIRFLPSTAFTYQWYKIGAAIRPQNITHDSGFSKLPKREPTASDYLSYYKWVAMLEGAKMLRPDLSDATAAYAHFLVGKGETREFSYARYIANDKSGQITLKNSVLEAQWWAIELWRNNRKPESFSFTGPAIPCGSSSASVPAEVKRAYPYPATENWQKAIGAHYIWLSGMVTVTRRQSDKPTFNMQFTLHAEDQYNFNPGQKDIVSGIPDDENGTFVTVGLAKGYRHESKFQRNFSWEGFDLGVQRMGISLPFAGRSPVASRR